MRIPRKYTGKLLGPKNDRWRLNEASHLIESVAPGGANADALTINLLHSVRLVRDKVEFLQAAPQLGQVVERIKSAASHARRLRIALAGEFEDMAAMDAFTAAACGVVGRAGNIERQREIATRAGILAADSELRKHDRTAAGNAARKAARKELNSLHKAMEDIECGLLTANDSAVLHACGGRLQPTLEATLAGLRTLEMLESDALRHAAVSTSAKSTIPDPGKQTPPLRPSPDQVCAEHAVSFWVKALGRKPSPAGREAAHFCNEFARLCGLGLLGGGVIRDAMLKIECQIDPKTKPRERGYRVGLRNRLAENKGEVVR